MGLTGDAYRLFASYLECRDAPVPLVFSVELPAKTVDAGAFPLWVPTIRFPVTLQGHCGGQVPEATSLRVVLPDAIVEQVLEVVLAQVQEVDLRALDASL